MSEGRDAVKDFVAMDKVDSLNLDTEALSLAVQGKRPAWNTYFMDIAEKVATRATCDRKHVGCVIVRDHRIVATGYNGSVRGETHCDHVGHHMVDGHCVRTLHAEINAVAQAAKEGVALKGCKAYITALPCWNCFKTLCNSGIAEIYFKEFYRTDETFKTYEAMVRGGRHKRGFWQYAGVTIFHVGPKSTGSIPWGKNAG